MRQALKDLGDFPMIGSAADESLVPGTRRLIVGEYVLTYDVSDSLIEVSAIRHGRMQASTPDADEDFDYESKP